ncbi:MAG: class I SAM-dependent methyltransferase [Methanobacteriota archaeon]|nr:MAG: class I SAM-dependent methyltransferase [Euryarchaeota archaeon]
MKVLDFGCGPGFFTVEIAERVGKSGSVVAADLQEGMLDILRRKIRGTDMEDRITLHKSSEQGVDLSQKVDFVFAFYVMHELENQTAFLDDFRMALGSKGMLYIAEPKAHVTKRGFDRTIERAETSGFSLIDRYSTFMTRVAVFKATVQD